MVEGLQILTLVVDAVAAQEQEELARRQHAYRDDLPSPNVKGKTVILVDDGIATGSRMIAAVAALRQLNAVRIVVAARSTFYQIHNATDEVATIIALQELYGVGQFYEDFSQTTDEEVRQLLSETNHHDRAAAA